MALLRISRQPPAPLAQLDGLGMLVERMLDDLRRLQVGCILIFVLLEGHFSTDLPCLGKQVVRSFFRTVSAEFRRVSGTALKQLGSSALFTEIRVGTFFYLCICGTVHSAREPPEPSPPGRAAVSGRPWGQPPQPQLFAGGRGVLLCA